VENADFSFHCACADAELDAACRSTELEETELHLRLALFHLERQSGPRLGRTSPAPKPASAGPPIYHTDKEG